MHCTVIKQDRHLRTQGKCRKHEPISQVFQMSRLLYHRVKHSLGFFICFILCISSSKQKMHMYSYMFEVTTGGYHVAHLGEQNKSINLQTLAWEVNLSNLLHLCIVKFKMNKLKQFKPSWQAERKYKVNLKQVFVCSAYSAKEDKDLCDYCIRLPVLHLMLTH